MFIQNLKQFGLSLVKTDPKLAWEIMQFTKYLEKWEALRDAPPRLRVPLPQPDPLPFDLVNTDTLFDIVTNLGAPEPETNLPPIFDRKMRIEGALAAAARMRDFADSLEKEAAALS